MSPDIDAIALVGQGSRNTAHVFATLDDDRLDVGSLQQLVGRGEPSRASADNNGNSVLQFGASEAIDMGAG